MEIGGKQYDQIIITEAEVNSESRLVTADDEKKVLVVISDEEVIEKDGFEVKLVPATPNN